MNGLESLGMLTFLRTYSKDGKESWNDTTSRYLTFMSTAYPNLKSQIYNYGQFIYDKKIVPSMRAFQNAGPHALNESMRIYNCAWLCPEDFKDFGDLCYLLCCGAGVGIGVQRRYSEKIPKIDITKAEEVFTVPDSREGWADAFIKVLDNPNTIFDISKIRPRGAPLSSGGFASGPEPLKEALEKIKNICKVSGGSLRPIDVADIVCCIAEAVVSGGARRSALIVLFDADDEEMLKFKSGNWWDTHIHRAKANVSQEVLLDGDNLSQAIKIMLDSPWGEPGIVTVKTISSDNTGTNPCGEISLRNRSCCNLTEIITPNCKTAEEFINAAKAAAFFGTLQAGMVNFNYIKSDWKETMKEDALLGVSLTGLAVHTPDKETLTNAVAEIKKINKIYAKKIGINPAKRLTTTKPSGTTSCVTGTTSGIHAAHGEYVIRRVRVTKSTPLGKMLAEKYGVSPSSLVDTEYGKQKLPINKYSFIVEEAYNDTDLVLQFPCHYKNAIYRKEESAIELLERAKFIYQNWILPGHNEGQETNNVSITVNYKPQEKQAIMEWMLKNTGCFRSISVLPEDSTAYPLLPFEEVTYEEWCNYTNQFPDVSWESFGITSEGNKVLSCSGGGCEVV